MKTSLPHILVLTSSLICFTSLKADGVMADLEPNSQKVALSKGTASLAQNAPMQKLPSSESRTPSSQKSCKLANNPHRIDIKHIEGKGIGYNQGYTSLDAFFTSLLWENYVPFFDVRAHVLNNGKWAANAGLGARYIFDPCHWMVGGNVYYDYRATKHGHYNQMSAGLEAFYDRYEVHLNGYLPVGQKRNVTKQHIESVTFKGFSGNYILQNEHYRNSYEGAMKGFNTELGMHLAGNRMQYDLYFGIGPYYYDVSSGKHAWGGKARLKAELTRYLFLELSDSYDRIFHNRVQGTVNISIPFGGKICYPQKGGRSCQNVMDWQAVLPVERQEIIVVSQFKKNKTIDPVAIDPVTGQPFFVVFVDNTNTNPNLGDGTFENPFRNLTNNDNAISAENFATDRNIIYVFAGDGSSAHMSGGSMVLSDDQRLLGSANAHPFQTTKGLLTVPALTTLIPHIQGQATGMTPGNIINLANRNEVSGFDISFPTFVSTTNNWACINGVPTANLPLIDANINHNNLVNETYGVILGSTSPNIATGTIILANNTSSGHGNSSTAAQGASYFIQGAQDATVTIVNNASQNEVNGAIGIIVDVYGNVSTTITDNTITNQLGSNGSNCGGIRCFELGSSGLPDLFTIQRNNVDNTAQASFMFRGFATVATLTTLIVEHNNFTNAVVQSVIGTQTASSTFCVRFNNNKGYPNQTVGSPYRISLGGGVLGQIFLENPMNNFPQLELGPITSLEPACFCGEPCN